jgi:hypothetical protein
MKSRGTTRPEVNIESVILTVRGEKVLLDMDLARIYGVPTKRLNEQVKRNLARFPDDFVFQLTLNEKAEVVANCDHLRLLKFSPVLPYAFTEQGALRQCRGETRPTLAAFRKRLDLSGRVFVPLRGRALRRRTRRALEPTERGPVAGTGETAATGVGLSGEALPVLGEAEAG